ncbi:hypothetical protein WLQ65_18230 [Pseudoalteromonas piscicida]|uniref:hypothetical protein n=1 Tax=Pseudoalteromonas piscicida TaxID=43662 RepID=UPI0030C98D57
MHAIRPDCQQWRQKHYATLYRAEVDWVGAASRRDLLMVTIYGYEKLVAATLCRYLFEPSLQLCLVSLRRQDETREAHHLSP